MELLALVQAPDHVCYRYRLQAFEPVLRAAGWKVTVLSLPRRLQPFLSMLPAVRQADVVFLQKRLLQAWKLRLIRRAARKLVFDVDDAIFHRDSNATKGHRSLARWRRFRRTVAASDAVTAGNEHLQAAVAAAGYRYKGLYFPTTVDVDAYPEATQDTSGRGLKLAWVGSASTLPSLQNMAPRLQAARACVPGISLRVICDVFPEDFPIPIERCTWSKEREAELIAGADVGVSWLPEHPWSRGKCGLKVLQYMAAGLPVLANPFGVHQQVIRQGETGYLAETPLEWTRILSKLASSPKSRYELGRRGRERAREEYQAQAWAARFEQMLRQLVQPGFAGFSPEFGNRTAAKDKTSCLENTRHRGAA